MFRSTHEKLVKSLQRDFESRLNAIKEMAQQQQEHDEARVTAEKTAVMYLKERIALIQKNAIRKGFDRDPRDVAATLVIALNGISQEALKYKNWEELPGEYRDMFYDIVYKLLGKPRKSKSSKKSAKNSA